MFKRWRERKEQTLREIEAKLEPTYDGLEAGYRYARPTPLPPLAIGEGTPEDVCRAILRDNEILDELPFVGVSRPADEAPSYEDLLEQNEALRGILEVHADTYRKAQHLLGVLGMIDARKKPIFLLNSEEHAGASIALIRHAIIDLQATLEGTELPALALDGRNMQ